MTSNNEYDDTVQIKNESYSSTKLLQQPKFRSKVKEEMQTLYINNNSQKLIMDTLRYIHGPNFQLTDISKYTSKKTRLKDKFWLNSGNLVVKSACDYSNLRDASSVVDTLRLYSINKLKSYGFHETHCIEALDYYNDNIDLALKCLYEKYHKIDPEENNQINSDLPCELDLLQQRIDEGDVLKSIYENSFEEKIPNELWTLTFKLDYLVELYSKNKIETYTSSSHQKKSSPICRNFSKTGQCKFGNKCRFSHEIEKKEISVDENNIEFVLEIRFDSNTKYPWEPPMILLKTNFTAMPKIILIFIAHRLLKESKIFTSDGIVCVYSLAELLNNSDDIKHYLGNTNFRSIDENEPLFPENINNSEIIDFENEPSHYAKNTKFSNISTDKNLEYNNEIILRNFVQKLENPKYISFLNIRKSLPAWNHRDRILKVLQTAQILLISGETGCGKSTQIPQFILENWLNLNDPKIKCQIVCTQPRRLSAIGVAERVAAERVERIGNTVGYQIRLESQISNLTRLTFCTTGILLMRLQSDPLLKSVTHIIVDEVHERSDESDFLLLILRNLLKQRPDLKVILMSATLNAELFSKYFGGIPTVEIAGRTFPVQKYFLENILEQLGGNYILEENSSFARSDLKTSQLDKELNTADVVSSKPVPDSAKDENLTFPQILSRYQDFNQKTCKNIFLSDPNKINYELIEAVLMWIVNDEKFHTHPNTGTILIFLPGFAEISTLIDYLINNPLFSPRQNNYLVLPLHSTLSNEEQSAIFRKPENGARKIILSTNIAETSITIDDCVYVIDSGKMKEKRFDSNKNMESLDTVWISRANALQRRGRAGRVMPGVCIHLYTSFRYHQLDKQPVPEMHRIPLEKIILRIKVLPNFEDDNVIDILQNVIEPPTVENISSSICRLQNVGALDEEEILTPLGHHLAALPVDVHIGKLILLGAVFRCVDAALTIAACLSYKSPFISSFQSKKDVDAKKQQFSVNNSDQMTVLNAYNKWRSVMERGKTGAYNFSKENYLSMKTLMTIADMKHQFLDLLISIDFIPQVKKIRRNPGNDLVRSIVSEELNENCDNKKLLAGVLCAALYPNVVKILTPGRSYQKCIGGSLPTVPDHDSLKFMTQNDGAVTIHPSSVNSKVGLFSSPYLVFQEKLKTSRIFIRETCMIPPLTLAFFAGCDLHIEVHSDISIISLDSGWIIFQTETHEVAEMIKGIRAELNKILEKKIKEPCLNLLNHAEGKRVIRTIIDVILNN